MDLRRRELEVALDDLADAVTRVRRLKAACDGWIALDTTERLPPKSVDPLTSI